MLQKVCNQATNTRQCKKKDTTTSQLNYNGVCYHIRDWYWRELAKILQYFNQKCTIRPCFILGCIKPWKVKMKEIEVHTVSYWKYSYCVLSDDMYMYYVKKLCNSSITEYGISLFSCDKHNMFVHISWDDVEKRNVHYMFIQSQTW